MSQARPSLALGTLLGGRYRIERPLGAGAMGSVYAGVQDGLGRKVAIKVLHGNLATDHDAISRFHREAQAAAALGHPNIVQVIDFLWPQNEQPFLVMEHLEGRSLADAIRGAGRLDPARIARIGRQVASALEAAHAAGIVHRDIKPDNIFLVDVPGVGETAKVLDFGIAKLSRPTDVQLTGDNTMLGSPAYMAPEQARGGALDHRADLFSLGSTMYVALTGRLPFDAQSLNALLFAIAEQAPPPIAQVVPGLDPRMAAIVERAMQKAPAARFQSAAEMRVALEAFSSGSVPAPGFGAPSAPVQSAAAYSAPPAPGWGQSAPPINTAAPPLMVPPPMAPSMQPPMGPGMQPPMPSPSMPQQGSTAQLQPAPRAGMGAGAIIGILAALVVVLLVAGGAAAYFLAQRGAPATLDTSPSATPSVAVALPTSTASSSLAPSTTGTSTPGALMPHNGSKSTAHADAGITPPIPGSPTAATSDAGAPAAGQAPMSGLSPRTKGGTYGNFPDMLNLVESQIGLVRPCYVQLQFTPPNHESFTFRFLVAKDGQVKRFLGGPPGTTRMPQLDQCVGAAMLQMNVGKSSTGEEGEISVSISAPLPH